MIKQLSEAVASWLKAYPDQDILKLIDHCRERIEAKKRGDIVNYIDYPFYDSRLQTEVDFTNWKKRQQYMRWIKNRKAGGKRSLTYEEWLSTKN